MLEIIAEYFCLRTNDVAAIQRRRAPTEDDKRTIRRTLAILHEEGLVSRLPYLDLEQESGGRTYAYGLSPKGCLLALDNGWTVDSCKPFDEHSQRTLDHELGISFFHSVLKNFCNKNGFCLYWRQRDLKKTIAPDALFAVSDARQPEGKDTLYYFLELERAKMGNFKDGKPSIIRKLDKYYTYYNSDTCEKEWETFRQFRVVVVQRSEFRRQHLLRVLRESHNHRMFWLTTESAYRRDVGATIFLTPRDYESHAYSFANRSALS